MKAVLYTSCTYILLVIVDKHIFSQFIIFIFKNRKTRIKISMLFSQDFVCFLRFFALSKKDKNITFERIRNKDAKCSFKRKKKTQYPKYK